MTREIAVLLIVLAVAFASMPVYAVVGARRPDRLESSSRGKFVLGGFLRSWFYWAVHPVVATAVALGLTPTFFNILGVVFGVAGGVAFATGNPALGGWGILLGGAADAIDGRIARAQGVAGPRGAFLDATLDRFAEFGVFVGLALWFRNDPLALALVSVGLGGSLTVSYARARGEVEGVLCTAGVMQRAERLLALGFGGLLDPVLAPRIGSGDPGGFLFWAVALVAVGTLGTALYRTVWIAGRLEQLEEGEDGTED
jgi:CDP-diacylglycerol--glycerol-3-phosphate 3-phosphatidyltransferase